MKMPSKMWLARITRSNCFPAQDVDVDADFVVVVRASGDDEGGAERSGPEGTRDQREVGADERSAMLLVVVLVGVVVGVVVVLVAAAVMVVLLLLLLLLVVVAVAVAAACSDRLREATTLGSLDCLIDCLVDCLACRHCFVFAAFTP